MARPEKLSEPVLDRLTQAIAIGATYEMACQYAGITYQTLRNWMQRGEKARSGAYVDLVGQVHAAEARAVVGWLAKIEKAANEGTWQAAAWKLERRYPSVYGRSVQQLEHGGVAGEPITIRIVDTTEGGDADANGAPE